MSRRNLRVKIPTDPAEIIQLAKDIKTKHTADGPLSPLPAAEIAELSSLLTTAEPAVANAEQLHRDAETSTQTRNQLLGQDEGQNAETPGTVLYIIRVVRNILQGRYLGQEQHLGDWGFEVDMSPRTPEDEPTPP
jgi:hypothetical protein